MEAREIKKDTQPELAEPKRQQAVLLMTIVMLPETERQAVLDRIRQACLQQLERQGDGPIRLPYLATLFWCQRLGD